MLSTVAMLIGGGGGIALRLVLEGRGDLRRGALVVDLAGAFLLGVLTGALLISRGAGAVTSTAVSSALFTYCLFGGAVVRLFRGEGTPLAVAVHVIGGLLAAVPGVLLGIWILG